MEGLKGIIFQEKLGSYFDKVQRIKILTAYLGSKLNLQFDEQKKIERTVILCKNDLLSEMKQKYPKSVKLHEMQQS